MRLVALACIAFALAALSDETEIRMAQVADEDLISIGGPAAESDLRKPNRITAKIHDLSSRLVYVYQEYLDAGGRAEGRLVLRFTIKEDGYLEGIEVVRETLRESELVEALTDKLSRWFFVRNRDAEYPGTVTCTYPFVFTCRVYYSPVEIKPLMDGLELHPRRRPYWVDKEITPYLAELEDIYDVYLLGNPSLSGTITVEFVIRNTGVVDRVTVIENTTEAVSLAADVAAKIAGWEFSALAESDACNDVIVGYPIYFGSGHAED